MIILTLLFVRIYDSQKGEPLSLWHTVQLKELTAKQIDNATWHDYLLAEDALFVEVKQKITDQLTKPKRKVLNRYLAGNPVNPNEFATNWNRSFILQPQGEPQGAVVLLHGLTDSPYSLRNIALHYQAKGFVAIVIRMPAHGTAPVALTTVEWQDWLAATRLAVRTVENYITADKPLHLVGYSNGGALALMYSLDALSDPHLKPAQQIILIAPMIGVTGFAKLAGLVELPAILPPFVRTRWIDIITEYNPFKYNSFPVNGARQSYQLTAALQNKYLHTNKTMLANLPPILTFISAVDNTIDNQATIDFYHYLADHNDTLVVFDVNRSRYTEPLLNDRAYQAVTDLLPPEPRDYNTIVVTNSDSQSLKTVAITTAFGQTAKKLTELTCEYPRHLYSLSHIGLTYPENDSLYGSQPAQFNEFGISLGALTLHGERRTLINSLDNLLRGSYNPFYPFLLEQIDETIAR
ncbi:alpha/beta fold hydrolase [Orbus sturtevantii]|uniref:alpha/beta hydrolase n=1 Tax=Orbus sturtevantii TaxID=3074109 RepID=UPI00370DA44C